MAGVGCLKRICKDAFCVAGEIPRDIFTRYPTRSGHWSPEMGCILEHQIVRFAKMILRDRCSTSYDLPSLFRGRCSTLERWSGKIAKRIGKKPPALHSTFLHFWRMSRRIASFWMLPTSVYWGSLAEFLRIGAVNLHFLRKPRRNPSFWTCQFPLFKGNLASSLPIR